MLQRASATNVGDPRGAGRRGASEAELLDVKQTARLVNISQRTVYRLVDAGKMPAPIKLGSLVRWRRAQLEAWIVQGCPAVQTQTGGAR